MNTGKDQELDRLLDAITPILSWDDPRAEQRIRAILDEDCGNCPHCLGKTMTDTKHIDRVVDFLANPYRVITAAAGFFIAVIFGLFLVLLVFG